MNSLAIFIFPVRSALYYFHKTDLVDSCKNQTKTSYLSASEISQERSFFLIVSNQPFSTNQPQLPNGIAVWSEGFKCANCITCKSLRTPPPQKKDASWHDRKLYLMVRPQFWRSGEFEVSLIAIIPRCTQTQSVGACWCPIYWSNKYA